MPSPDVGSVPVTSDVTLLSLRALDGELRAQVRGRDPEFKLANLAFFQEATGALQEEHIQNAQSSVCNARKAALAAAYKVFKSSLANDVLLHEKHLAAASGSEARTRATILNSLEATLAISKCFTSQMSHFV